LIVDDEAPIRGLLKCALSDRVNAVYEADSGAAALRIAATHGPFALVVSDVLMPGMDGIELARKLSSGGHATKFLFMSGYCAPETIEERAGGLGDVVYLPKPFTVADLLRVVKPLLG